MRSSDAGEVLERCLQWLAARPVEHNVAISLLEDRAERGVEGRYWWVEEPSERLGLGFMFQTPLTMVAGIVPPSVDVVVDLLAADVLDLLAGAVAEEAPDLPGVVGEAATAAAFAGRFATLRKCAAVPVEGQRLYSLDAGALVAPSGVPGRLRRADVPDHEMVMEWAEGFDRETGGPFHDAVNSARQALDSGRLFVWEVPTEGVVSLALHSVPVAGVCRIAMVYTPPARRRQGYAAACVTALSRHCLESVVTTCALYTQLSNPTSNSVYQRIGYVPVMEAVRYRFG